MKWTEEQIALFKQTTIQSLLGFCVYTDKFFEVNAHHKLLANKLQQFMEGKKSSALFYRLPLEVGNHDWYAKLLRIECESLKTQTLFTPDTVFDSLRHSLGTFADVSIPQNTRNSSKTKSKNETAPSSNGAPTTTTSWWYSEYDEGSPDEDDTDWLLMTHTQRDKTQKATQSERECLSGIIRHSTLEDTTKTLEYVLLCRDGEKMT